MKKIIIISIGILFSCNHISDDLVANGKLLLTTDAVYYNNYAEFYFNFIPNDSIFNGIETAYCDSSGRFFTIFSEDSSELRGLIDSLGFMKGQYLKAIFYLQNGCPFFKLSEIHYLNIDFIPWCSCQPG